MEIQRPRHSKIWGILTTPIPRIGAYAYTGVYDTTNNLIGLQHAVAMEGLIDSKSSSGRNRR